MRYIWVLTKILRPILLVLIFASPIAANAQGSIIYSPSIMSFLTGIDSLQAQFNLDLNNGVFYKKVDKQEIYLKIVPNTISRTELILVDNAITKLVYKFSEPLIFKDATNLNCSGVYLSGININNKEVILDYTMEDKRSCRRLNEKIIKNLMQLFNLPGQFSDFVKGNGLGPQNSVVWADCTNNFQLLETSRNIIKRITILPSTTGASKLVFKAKKKLVLSDSQDYDNQILTDQKNSVLINDLQSEPEGGNLTFNLSVHFKSIEKCIFQSKGLSLTLPKPTFKNFTVNLISIGGETKQLLVNAELNSSIGENSFLKIEGSKSSSTFNIDKGSSLSIPNLNLEFSGRTKTEVKFGLGSSLSLRLKNSELALNNFSTIHINKGSIGSTSLAAEFYNDRPQNYWQGNLRDIAFEVDGGILALNDNSQLQVQAGSILSDVMNIDNTINPLLTGRFKKFQFFFTSNNIFACNNNGFKFDLQGSSYINQMDENPVRLEKDEKFPLGTLEYHLEFAKFKVNGKGQLNMNEGTFDCHFSNIGKEQFSAKDVKIKGLVDVTIKDKTISTAVDLRGRLDFSKQNGPDFFGNISFIIDTLKKAETITTDCKNDYELDWGTGIQDEHIFPVKIEVNLDQAIAINNIHVDVKRGLLQPFSSQTDGVIKIKIPQGYGEYDGDNLDCGNIASNVHNEKRGEDDIEKLQEVVRGTVHPPVRPANCTFHLWAEDKSYTVPFTLNFEYQINEGTLKPVIVLYPKIDLRSLELGYKTHGCDDIFTKTVMGIFVDLKQKIKENMDKKLGELSDKFSQMMVLKFD